MPSNNIVQLTWAIDQLSDNAFSVARGILKAATSDNVQPLALLAAEAFGNTLAICQQTQLLVEREASRRHVSSVIKFLQLTVGYSADDSCAQLAKSSAGVRFLSLAAALLTTNSYFEAARALEEMIRTTAGRNQLLPTIPQLQDLIQALEPKLMRLDFANSVVGWESYLVGNTLISETLRERIRIKNYHPEPDALVALIGAFRIIGRVGESQSDSSIVITARTCFPWIIGFTKWCLGSPPLVVLEDDSVVVEQSDCRVMLKILENECSRKDDCDIQVKIFHNMEKPSVLWTGHTFDAEEPDTMGKPHWSGMVSVMQYGSRRIRSARLDTSQGFRALSRGLSYGLPLILKYLRVDSHEFSQYLFPLFPSPNDVCRTMNEFMDFRGPEASSGFAEVTKDGSITDLTTVSAYLESLRAACQCSHCTGDSSSFKYCDTKHFRRQMVEIVIDILALSLFDCSEPIRVFLRLTIDDIPDGFQNAVEKILFESAGVVVTCHPLDPIKRALTLIGHIVPFSAREEWMNRTWVASAGHGQGIFLAFFDTINFDGRALTILAGGPGQLRYHGVLYDLVMDSSSLQSPRMLRHEEPVDGPRNLAPQAELVWKVFEADQYLDVSMGPSMPLNLGSPMSNFQKAAKALYIPNCKHGKEARMAEPDKKCFYTTLCYFNDSPKPDEGRDDRTPVVAVAGDANLRFLALAGAAKAVIRGDACLKCCIHVCRLAGFDYVVS